MARNRASDLAALAGVGLAGYMAAREGRKDKAPVEDRRPPASSGDMQADMNATTPVSAPVDTSNVDLEGIGRANTYNTSPRSKVPPTVPTVASKPVNKDYGDDTLRKLGIKPAPISKDDIELALRPTAVKLDQSGKPYKTLSERGVVVPSRLSRMFSAQDNPEARSTYETGIPMKRGGAVKRMASGGSVKATVSRRGDGIAQRGKTKGRFV